MDRRILYYNAYCDLLANSYIIVIHSALTILYNNASHYRLMNNHKEFILDVNQFISLIQPNSLGDVFIYILFFGALIASGIMPEGKNSQPIYLMFAVIFCCVVDLLRGSVASFPIPGFDNEGFGTFILHIMMGVFPFIAAGMARTEGRKGGLAVPVLILMGLIGTVYAFGSFVAPDAFYNAL